MFRCCTTSTSSKVSPIHGGVTQSPTRSLLVDIQENAHEEIQILNEEIQRKKSEDLSEEEIQQYIQKVHEHQVLIMNAKSIIKQQQQINNKKQHRRVISYSATY
jgi:hypothetical protein